MPRYDDEHPLRESEFDWAQFFMISGIMAVVSVALLLVLHFTNGAAK
jgi:hypothetical protein